MRELRSHGAPDRTRGPMAAARRWACAALIGAACALLAACTPKAEPQPALGGTPTTPPNILIIVADDLGYSDLGCFGGEQVGETV